MLIKWFVSKVRHIYSDGHTCRWRLQCVAIKECYRQYQRTSVEEHLRPTPSSSDRNFQKLVVVECPHQGPAVLDGIFNYTSYNYFWYFRLGHPGMQYNNMSNGWWIKTVTIGLLITPVPIDSANIADSCKVTYYRFRQLPFFTCRHIGRIT